MLGIVVLVVALARFKGRGGALADGGRAGRQGPLAGLPWRLGTRGAAAFTAMRAKAPTWRA